MNLKWILVVILVFLSSCTTSITSKAIKPVNNEFFLTCPEIDVGHEIVIKVQDNLTDNEITQKIRSVYQGDVVYFDYNFQRNEELKRFTCLDKEYKIICQYTRFYELSCIKQ